MRVTVAEGNHQRTNFGVGYGTEEKARVDAEYHHLNFFGGARVGRRARALVVARSRRPRSISTSRTSSRRTSRSASTAQQWYTYTPAYRSTVVGRQGDADAPAERAHLVVGVDHQRARQQPDHRRGVRQSRAAHLLHRPRPRSDDARAERHAQRARRRLPALDRRQPAERAPRLSDRAARGRSRAARPRHASTTTRRPPTAATTCRSPTRSWSPAALQIGNIRPVGEQSGERAVRARNIFLGGATSIRGWGRYEVSVRSSTASRSAATACSRSARSCARRCTATSAACCFSTAATSGRESLGLQAQRSALRDRSRPALSDAGRSDPLRHRLSAEPDAGSDRQRQPADAAVAHALQHRAGVLRRD